MLGLNSQTRGSDPLGPCSCQRGQKVSSEMAGVSFAQLCPNHIFLPSSRVVLDNAKWIVPGFESRPLLLRSSTSFLFSGHECGSGQPILRQGEEALEADEVRRSSVQEGS